MRNLRLGSHGLEYRGIDPQYFRVAEIVGRHECGPGLFG